VYSVLTLINLFFLAEEPDMMQLWVCSLFFEVAIVCPTKLVGRVSSLGPDLGCALEWDLRYFLCGLGLG
jgi:hypothetical protein